MSVIARWENFILVPDRSGMQLINTSMEHSEKYPYGHSHNYKCISKAKKVAKDVLAGGIPRDRTIEHLQDMVRVTPGRKRRKELEQLIDIKIDKKKSCNYVNHQGAGA